VLALEFMRAIARAKTTAALDHLTKTLYRGYGSGIFNDAETTNIQDALLMRKATLCGQDTIAARIGATEEEQQIRRQIAMRPTIFPPKRPQRSPNRRKSILRRRQLAASGPLPPLLASHFTTGQLAVLRIIADEFQTHGVCARTLGEIASRAGVCIALARNAVRTAERLHLILTEYRRKRGQKNDANLLRIVSKDWLVWLAIGPKLKRGRSNATRCPEALPLEKRVAVRRHIAPKNVGPSGSDLKRSLFLANRTPKKSSNLTN
jgi:hypothetical protein